MSSSKSSYPGAVPPPPDYTANINSPRPSIQKAWIAGLVVELAIPTLLLPARIYARRWILRSWSLSDYSAILAWALFAANIGISFSLLDYGVGQYAWNLTTAEFERYSELLNIEQIVYMPAIAFTKNTILLQLIEIFVPRGAGTRYWILVGLIIFNFFFFTAMLFVEIFECTPRSKIWDANVPGHCIDIDKTFIATAAVNVAEDLTILVLPIYWTFQLHADNRKKWKAFGIFAMALFAIVCSIMRLIETCINVSNPDISTSLLPVSLWTTAEISSGLVVACAPYLPVIIVLTMRSLGISKATDPTKMASSKVSNASIPTEKSRPDNLFVPQHFPERQRRPDSLSSTASTLADRPNSFSSSHHTA